ncbi:MAG TPA: lipoyl synthase [Candidatus Krumholzibacterium sp.]|nr:lipoyl synthase [Candidatus Krumholzibacterium sp.]
MTSNPEVPGAGRLPHWLKRKIPLVGECSRIEGAVRRRNLHTICREGLCPNRAECYSKGKVTFMMLGDRCTRHCRFCSVTKGEPAAVDPSEPERIAEAAAELGLGHVIVTSVTRDDLPDGGASVYAELISCLKRLDPVPVIEVLVPDFRGDLEALGLVLEAGPDIFSHNIETVKRLFPVVRPDTDYERSLTLLAEAGRRGGETRLKSSMMLGLGETRGEVLDTMRDLREAGCHYTALGQYLRPGVDQIPVSGYIPPDDFKSYEEEGYGMGFLEVTAGPLVRSSYQENDPARVTPECGIEDRAG